MSIVVAGRNRRVEVRPSRVVVVRGRPFIGLVRSIGSDRAWMWKPRMIGPSVLMLEQPTRTVVAGRSS